MAVVLLYPDPGRCRVPPHLVRTLFPENDRIFIPPSSLTGYVFPLKLSLQPTKRPSGPNVQPCADLVPADQEERAHTVHRGVTGTITGRRKVGRRGTTGHNSLVSVEVARENELAPLSVDVFSFFALA
jgi:hypothetical protein